MKSSISKGEAKKHIDTFFERSSWSPEEMRKIKLLAMKHRISLKSYKKKFCKYCLSHLKGNIRIKKAHKTIVCKICGRTNRYKISQKS